MNSSALQPSTTSLRKKLHIVLQTLSRLMEDGCYYADKSGYAVDLAQAGIYYFFSRPRRFGKSLFLDTLKELFEGHAALFKGLAAETRWDWSKQHPVIRINFGDGVLKSRAELEQRILIRPCEVSSCILDVTILEVGHDALGGFSQRGHEVIGSLT